MDLACEDLADLGLHLVAPSHSEYGGMFADVVRRLAQRVSGGPPVPWQDVEFLQNHRSDGHAAILRNESSRVVVALAFVWTVQMPNGASLNCNSKMTKALPLFFPFRTEASRLPHTAFWESMLPMSNRVVGSEGLLYGDNTDVRPPEAPELWQGGYVYARGDGRNREWPLPLKLTLDGVFFADGGFAGPNSAGLWEEVTEMSEGYSMLAAMARRTLRGGLSEAEFLGYVESLCSVIGESRLGSVCVSHGPHTQAVGREARNLCERIGMATALARMAGWGECKMPEFYRLGRTR